MTSQADAFSNQSAAKRSDVEERSAGLSLRIAVLGPNLDDIGNERRNPEALSDSERA